MNRRMTSAIAAGALCVAGIFSAMPASAYNVAVLPAWRNWQHVHDFDWVLRANGFTYTNCQNTAEQMEYLFKNLDKYDMLIAPPLFGYLKLEDLHMPEDRPYDMKKYAPILAKWIQDGGCLLGFDMNYPQAMDWIKEMDPLMDVSANVDPADMKTEAKCWRIGPPVVENNDSILYFPRSASPDFTWGHMVIPPALEGKSAWKVIATCGHGHGYPTLMVRRWGKGIVVFSACRSYPSELIENVRANQRFSQMGIAILDCAMQDPLPGTNLFSFVCENNGDKPFTGELELTVVPQIDNPEKPGQLIDDPKAKPLVFRNKGTAQPGSQYTFELPCRISYRGDAVTRMKFIADGQESVIFERRIVFPELFTVSGPPYRSSVSVNRRFSNVSFVTSIYPDGEDLSKLSVQLNIGTKKYPAGAKFPALYGKTIHPVSVNKRFPAGDYQVVGSLLKEGVAEPIAVYTNVLHILDNSPSCAVFDEDNTLLVEGQPFFPLGIYHPRDKKLSYQGFRDVANVGFNVENLFGWMGVGTLDLLHPVDAYCLYEQNPHRSPLMIEEHSWTLAWHPSSLINYTVDEPPEQAFGAVRDLDKAWHKFDPRHPTYLASYQPHHFRRNAEISDILAPDPYPYTQTKGEDSDIALVSRRVDLARAASDGINPVFCVPQAFGCEPPDIWRVMGMLAITHGAKGLIWYAWNEKHPGPYGGLVWHDDLIAVAEEFLAQVKAIAPAILGDENNIPRMFTGSPTNEVVSSTIMDARKSPYGTNIVVRGPEYNLHGMVCRDPNTGTRYLLLANSSKEQITMDIPLPEAGEATEILGAFDDSKILVTNGVAKIDLPKFGSGVWYWDGPKPIPEPPISTFAVRELPARCSGKTLTVAAKGAAYTNLQAAIDAAVDGDVIKVGEGDWGSIVCANKLIDIVATGACTNTFISGTGGRAATLSLRPRGEMNFETNTLVRGFTIRNGNSATDPFRPKFGGGVYGGTLVSCRVEDNNGRYGGGAAYANIFDCLFTRNKASVNGGAAAICNAYDSLFDGNSASYDGGAVEFCTLEGCTLKANKAGRRGGGMAYGSAYLCTFNGNSAEHGGGACNGSIKNCLVIGNFALKTGAGAGSSAYFCTFANNHCALGGEFPANTGCCYDSVLLNNTIDRNGGKPVRQVNGYHGWGSNIWTDNGEGAAGDVHVVKDLHLVDFRPTMASPFINTASGDMPRRSDKDLDGNPRISGAEADAGAFEAQLSHLQVCDLDFSKGDPFEAGLLRKSMLADMKGYERPVVGNESIVFKGTNICTTSFSISGRGGSSDIYSRGVVELVFKAESAGPVFTLGNGLTVMVDEEGRLNVVSEVPGKNPNVNKIQSPKKITDKKFHTLVIENDKFGCLDGFMKAKLDGVELPTVQPFNWKKPRSEEIIHRRFWAIGGTPTFGGKGALYARRQMIKPAEFFKGEVKSLKIDLYAD